MQIEFLGGARTVTGSQHLITVNGKKILLECGLFQGRRRESYERNLNFAFKPSEIDALVLSHAHIDHSGNIPTLCRKGYKGPIHATPATVDLCRLMLLDSAYLNQRDVEWVNKIRASRREDPIEALYTVGDAEQSLTQFESHPYYESFPVAEGVSVTYRDAGHILGSATVLLEIDEDGKKIRLGFSGDIGKHPVPILRDPEPFEDIDALIMESTYGDRVHEDDKHSEEELAKVINEVIGRGGNLIIPAFAVGRTQHLVYALHLLLEKKRIPRTPIYVDSPMACKAMDIFRKHPTSFDKETYDHFVNDDKDPFAPEGFACITDVAASKRINEIEDPKIIISASGMMEGGRVLHHLRNNIGDKRSMVLFVGFAAQHTLARRLMDGAEKVKIFGEEYRVQCETRIMPYYSAHADRDGLLEFLAPAVPDRLKNVFLVHGEERGAMALRDRIMERGYSSVKVPEPGDLHTI